MKNAVMILVVLFITGGCFAEPAVMVQGWSWNQPDPNKAIEEAVKQLTDGLKGRQPAIIFFSGTTIDQNIPAAAKAVQDKFKDVPIWGSTSALGIFMNNDSAYMRGSVVGLLALCSQDYRVFVQGAAVEDYGGDYLKAAKSIILEAKKYNSTETPDIVLLASDPGQHEEIIIEELKKAYGRFVPVFGGSSGTEAPNKRYSIANGKSCEKGMSLCFIYTTKDIGYCYQMGYKRKDVGGIATDVNGRWLKTIDDKPALEVYDQWTDGFFTEAIKNGQSLRSAGQMYHPLAMIKKSSNGEEFVVSLSAKGYSVQTGAVEFFACVNKGDSLTVLKGDTDSLVGRAYLAVAKASRMAKGKIAGGLVFYCSGARLLLEEQNRTSDMAPQLKQAFRNAPFMLTFNNGEHGCIPDSESFHGNLMLDVVVFGE